MTRRVWVVGPIAWDSVYYLDKLPQPGEFAQTYRNVERPGGTAANSAIAIATAGIETGFAGYVGDDDLSSKLIETLKNSEIKNLHMQYLPGAPSHVAIYIDRTGERTIFGLSEDRLDVVTLAGANLQPGDVVVFQLWREHFRKDLELARAAQCIIIVGVEALTADISADVVIGSESDSLLNLDMDQLLTRFKRVVITHGARGATEYSSTGTIELPALNVDAVDATGAGDAFLAGYITALARDIEGGRERLTLGITWAALAVQSEKSIPPHYSEVEKFLNR